MRLVRDGSGAGRLTRRLLIGLVAVAAALRFGTLNAKSYWTDEGLTIQLLRLPLGSMLHVLRTTEPDPPLYFLLARLWAAVGGYGEIALRSLSALAGTLTVPVTFLVGRRFAGRRAGVIAAALVACNPLLIWYSQDARPYALFALLAALSLWALGRAVASPSPMTIGLWILVAALTVATHYFGLLTVVPEALWLLAATASRGPGRRGRLLAVGVLVGGAAALTLVAARGAPAREANFGAIGSLVQRTVGVVGALIAGFEAGPRKLMAATGVLLSLGVIARMAARRRMITCDSTLVGAVGMATLLGAILAALVGHDYVTPRNLIAVVVPLAVVLGAAIARVRDRWTLLAGAGLCAIGLTAITLTAWTPKYHYQDLRQVAARLGHSAAPRAIVLAPDAGAPALAVYLAHGLVLLPPSGARVAEVDVVASRWLAAGQTDDPPPPVPSGRPVAPTPAFQLVAIDREPRFTLLRFRSVRPEAVSPAIVRSGRFASDAAAAFVAPGGA